MLQKFTKCLVWSVLIVSLILILLLINSGFDLTDEGLYLLMFSNIDQKIPTVLTFHKVYGIMFPFLEPDIINMRLLKIGLIILPSLLLSFGLKRYLETKNLLSDEFKWTIYPLILLGSVVICVTGPKSLGYNSMTSAFMIIATALLLIYRTVRDNSIHSLIIIIFIGYFSTVVLFSKVSAGIIYVPLMLLMVQFSTGRFLRKILLSSFFLLGVLVALIHFTYFNGNLSDEIKGFITAMNIVQEYSPGHTNSSFLDNTLRTFLWMIKFAALSLFIYTIINYLKKYTGKYSLSQWLFIFMFLTMLIPGWIFTFRRNFYILPVFLLLISTYREYRADLHELFRKYIYDFAGLLFIFISPLIGSLGSTAHYGNLSVYAVTLWISLAIVLMQLRSTRFIKYFSIILIVSLSLIRVVYLELYKPYRTESFTENDYTLISDPRGFAVKSDSSTFNLVNKTRDILVANGYRVGDEILGFHRMPGLIYLLGGRPFGGFIWGGPEPAAILRSVTRTPFTCAQKPGWIIINNDDKFHNSNGETMRILSTLDLKMSDYLHLGDIFSGYVFLPEISVYKKKDCNYNFSK